jgi:UrcA family protein
MTYAAPPAGDVPSIVVKCGDLNLSTEDGACRLYGRIVTAAREVCDRHNSRDLPAFTACSTCESTAIARAVSDFDSPRLAVAYAMRINYG